MAVGLADLEHPDSGGRHFGVCRRQYCAGDLPGHDSGANIANDFKPPECAALNLNNIVVGSGTINGTNQNDLILGSPFNDTVNGRNGAECILGGGGNDYIEGRQGNDVLLGGPGDDTLMGGPGNDTLIGGPGNDYCEGGGGADVLDPSCEIQIP